jgi:hypothetical protein
MASRPSRRSRPNSAAPSAGPPGAATAFLVGDYAAVTLNNGGGAVTFNIFEWRVEFRTTTVNTRAHGQFYARPLAVERAWTFTGRGYITAASASHAVNAGYANDTTAQPTFTVSGYSGTTSGTKIFEGTGIMTRGTIDAPDGAMAVQDIEIEGYGTPATGV